MDHVTSLNVLHKSQIGFLPNNRTADHVFKLRTLIDKYVPCQIIFMTYKSKTSAIILLVP